MVFGLLKVVKGRNMKEVKVETGSVDQKVPGGNVPVTTSPEDSHSSILEVICVVT